MKFSSKIPKTCRILQQIASPECRKLSDNITAKVLGNEKKSIFWKFAT